MLWCRKFLLFIAFLAATVLGQIDGQIGEDICACSPTTFTFTLSFETTCPGTVEENDGISAVECFGIPVNTTDLTPVKADSVQVLELNINFQTIATKDYEGPFFEGESIIYTSVATGNITRPEEVPGAIQLNIRLRNQEEKLVLYAFTAVYTNDCDFTPIFEKGDILGPIVLVRRL